MEAQKSGMADLAARLTKRLADANSSNNLVFSPLSIYAVLALLAAGAGGDTLEEVLRVLGARSRRQLEDSVTHLLDGPLRDTSESGGPSVAFAYGVWSDLTRPMKPAYRDAVVGTYKAEAGVVDFLNDPDQAKGKINAWAAKATRNLITSAVPPGPLDPDTKLVLANAIYFRGKWDLPFYESQTMNKPFYRLDGTAVDVPFMTNYSRHYIAEHDGFKVLKLRYKSSPYTRSNHCMCIFLPDARDGLGGLLDKVTSTPGFLREHLPNSPIKVGRFRVPKFELSFESSVTAVLKDLGLRLPFTPEADLSEMLEDDGSNLPLLVQDVFQKAVIEVNEEGTKAAAVTTAFCAYSPTSCPDLSRRVDFVADHPFAYFIVEEGSDGVIFAGHVVDPSNGTGAVVSSPAPFQEYTTTKRKFDEDTEYVNGRFKNAYDTTHSSYSPVSPVYNPVSQVYQYLQSVYKPTSPAYSPVSPVYRPTSPAYSPVSPVYRPTVPFESNRVSPAVYCPRPLTELTDELGSYQPKEVEEMSSGALSKATDAQPAGTGENELLIEKRE